MCMDAFLHAAPGHLFPGRIAHRFFKKKEREAMSEGPALRQSTGRQEHDERQHEEERRENRCELRDHGGAVDVNGITAVRVGEGEGGVRGVVGRRGRDLLIIDEDEVRGSEELGGEGDASVARVPVVPETVKLISFEPW
jgi:hypothetical protein